MQNALKWDDVEFSSLKFLKLKYARGGTKEAIQLFYSRIGFPPHPWKSGPLLNLGQFQKTAEK